MIGFAARSRLMELERIVALIGKSTFSNCYESTKLPIIANELVRDRQI